MNGEKLIESVKKPQILYERTTKAYKDAARKEDAWQKVAGPWALVL